MWRSASLLWLGFKHRSSWKWTPNGCLTPLKFLIRRWRRTLTVTVMIVWVGVSENARKVPRWQLCCDSSEPPTSQCHEICTFHKCHGLEPSANGNDLLGLWIVGVWVMCVLTCRVSIEGRASWTQTLKEWSTSCQILGRSKDRFQVGPALRSLACVGQELNYSPGLS